jgi:hypothetical protein
MHIFSAYFEYVVKISTGTFNETSDVSLKTKSHTQSPGVNALVGSRLDSRHSKTSCPEHLSMHSVFLCCTLIRTLVHILPRQLLTQSVAVSKHKQAT